MKKKTNNKLKQILIYLSLVVLVFTLTSGSECVDKNNSLANYAINSWGTSVPNSPEDYVDELNALNDAFADMEDLLDELEQAIAAAKDATIDCSDITLVIANAISANDTDTVTLKLKEGEEILTLANSVYESLLAAIEAVEIQLEEINAITTILNNAGQDTSDFSTGNAADLVADGKTTAGELLTAMTTLEETLGDAREFLGITDTISNNVSSSTDIIGGAFQPIIFILNSGTNARYDLNTESIFVPELFVSASGSNLRYQWFVNSVNSNIGGTLITGATNHTYKPFTSVAGTFYYYCVVSSTGYSSITTSTITVEIVQQHTTQAPTIIKQPQSAVYYKNEVTAPLTVVATGHNLTYQWYSKVGSQAAVLLVGETSASFTPSTTANGTISYYCTVTSTENNVSSTIHSDMAVIDVDAFEIDTGYATNYNYAWGVIPHEMDVAPTSGTAPYTYQWYKNGSAIEGATNNTYTPKILSSVNAPSVLPLVEVYYCIITDATGIKAKSVTSTLNWDDPFVASLVVNTDTVELDNTTQVNTYTYTLKDTDGVTPLANTLVTFTFPVANVNVNGTDLLSTIYSTTTDATGVITFDVIYKPNTYNPPYTANGVINVTATVDGYDYTNAQADVTVIS